MDERSETLVNLDRLAAEGAARLERAREGAIRDMFAAQALAGILASSGFGPGAFGHAEWAKDAFDLADAMMAERKKREANDG